MNKPAAVLFTAMTAGVVAFQLALAAGAPFGAYAMGGAFPGVFPPALRVAALVQGFLLSSAAAIVLVRAGLLLPRWLRQARWLIWGVVALDAVSFVLNLITPSELERAIWAPVAFVLLGSSVTVALGRPQRPGPAD